MQKAGFSQVEALSIAPSTQGLATFTLSSSYLSDSRSTHFSSKLSTFPLSTFEQCDPALRLRAPLATFAATKKKYKPVAKKVRPMLADLPERYRIIRNIVGDPLATMPTLSTHPPPFKPTGRYTEDRKLIIDKAHQGDFLWPAERDLMHHFMCLHQDGFAWHDSEHGHFREDYFPPVEMPTVPHKPWIVRNLPIPPGIFDQVCKEIQRKIDAGIYKPSNSSYRSRWFCVVKKDGTSL